MPIYQSDAQKDKFQTKTTVVSNYISDQRAALFGGRGGRDKEIDYLHSKAGTTGDHLSDGWQAFGSKRGVTGNRPNETKRKFFEEKTFP